MIFSSIQKNWEKHDIGCMGVYNFAKWYKYILSDLSLVLFKSKKYKSVVHVRCIGDGKMVDHQSVLRI